MKVVYKGFSITPIILHCILLSNHFRRKHFVKFAVAFAKNPIIYCSLYFRTKVKLKISRAFRPNLSRSFFSRGEISQWHQ